MASTERYDLVVVGSGPGGYIAAIRAAQLGMRVACVEKEKALGGTCLNIGCIPSKALLDSSEIYYHARHAAAPHGVKIGSVELDLATMLSRKDRVVKRTSAGVGSLFKKHKIDSVQGRGRLASAERVVVTGEGEERTLETERILVATGSEATPLREVPFDGERVVSSTEALSLPAVPQRMIVIGAGAVGLELGSVWNRLGSDVTVVEFMNRIVPPMDHELGKQLQAALKKQGMKFKLETGATGATRTNGGVKVTFESKGERFEEEAEVVLVAVGRRPYTAGLGAREIGVAFDDRGRITVDEHYETSVHGVYAIGDVIPGPMLAHKAEEEGVAAVELMAGQAGHVNYDAVPNVVYTWPELASVGLSEEDAAARGIEVAKGWFPFAASARARAMNESDGGVKVLADAKTDRLVGIHILGPRASDLIAEAALAVEFGGSAEDIARSVHAHPTLAEALKEAALGVAKRSLNI
jgi:dihydrolipoamide dehydrogenase